MDRKLRNDLRLAVIACRKLLTDDVAQQLEGQFGISESGAIASESALPQLDAAGLRDRRSVVAALEHLRAQGASPRDAVERFVRETAFSILNRLVALKLLEAPERKLILESIGQGAASRGFRQFVRLSPEAVAAEPDGGYRLYLDLLCDDLAHQVGALFDLRQPAGILFPGELALRAVLAELNAPALASVWAEDETLGWVYQYFTPKELRDTARKASAAPRDANELAFRNQFYTPRYVVDFLVQNTLGRIWYEARRGETSLADPERCPYLVRRAHPIWLARGEPAPLPFTADDEFQRPDPARLWTRPNPDWVGDVTALWQYAGTIDGYRMIDDYLALHEEAAAATTAKLRQTGNPVGLDIRSDQASVDRVMAFGAARLDKYETTGRWDGSFEDLRLTLFALYREDHFSDSSDGFYDDGAGRQRLRSLNQAICRRWDLETEVIAFRPWMDPRTLRVLDPACGSGHFLLAAFELLLTIYAEAWADPDLPPFPETGRTLRSDYPDEAALAAAVPELILRHNLHGIDIDLRAVQIAQLALWLRAQRAWSERGLRPGERPPVTRLDIVAAEPMPGEMAMRAEFLQSLGNPAIANVVADVWQETKGLGEIGSIFKADELIGRLVREQRRSWQSGTAFHAIPLFGEPAPRQRSLDLDTTFISDEAFWDEAEATVLAALRAFADAAVADTGERYGRRLFAQDTAQGFAFLELFTRPFDVVLMNPPFGAVSHGARDYVEHHYPLTKNDLYAAFVERGLEVMRPRGYLGAITSRTGFFLTSFQKWREEVILGGTRIHAVADLGQGVLDTAMVETAAYTLEKR